MALSIEAFNCRVELDPPPADPNQPQYPVGADVTLEVVPSAFMRFDRWLIYDPNSPGDGKAPPAVIDSNSSITIMMDDDRNVEAVCKCGSSSPLLPMTLGAFGLIGVVRRTNGIGQRKGPRDTRSRPTGPSLPQTWGPRPARAGGPRA